MTVHSYTSNKPYMFRAILDWLLDNDATPYILVDTTKSYVEVPEEHIKDGQIVLNITPSAIQNWHADEKAISFNARFSGSARQIYVPMNALMAIYAQENGQGMAFPAEVIPEGDKLDTDSNKKAPENKHSSKPKSKPKSNKVSHLKVIK